jgi:hypothetical protein
VLVDIVNGALLRFTDRSEAGVVTAQPGIGIDVAAVVFVERGLLFAGGFYWEGLVCLAALARVWPTTIEHDSDDGAFLLGASWSVPWLVSWEQSFLPFVGGRIVRVLALR